MLANISKMRNKSLILELSEGQDVGTIGGYCEGGFPVYYANDKIAHMLGYTNVDDLLNGVQGMVVNIIHPEDMERVSKELNNGDFYEGMTYKITCRMSRKDGSSIWTVNNGKVVLADDGKLVIIFICNDMTEFIDRHNELERLNQFSKTTIENMPGGYHRCAAEDGYPFLYVSDRFCEMFGWTRDEIKAEFDNKFINMVHPEDKGVTEEYAKLLNQSSHKNVIDTIYRMRSKNGYIWVSDSTSLVTVGNKTFYQGTLTDITNFVVQRKNEEDLRNEQLMVFDTLARHFKNVYWLDLEKKTGRILKLDASYVDVPSMNHHHEFSFEIVLKNWINTIVYPEDREKVSETITLENIKKVFETRDEFVGNYRSLVNGEIHHFQYSFFKANKDGTKAVAGFQNIDDIIVEHQKVEKAKRKEEIAKQKEVEEQLAIINALCNSFRNVFVANLTEGTARAIRLADNYNVRAIRDVKDQIFQFDAVIDRWVREAVHPDDKKRIKETLNVKNIREVFSKQDKYVGTYRNIENGVQHYYQYDFRRVGDTDNVVVGFQLIDKIVEEQTAHKKELEEQFAIINTLSRNYMNIYLANLNDGSARAIRVSENYGYKEVSALKDVSFSIDKIIESWAEKYIYPNEDKDKMSKMLSTKNLREVFSKQESYIGNYQSTEQGAVHHYQFDIRKVDDSGNVVAGFQNIDAIIEEHEAQEKEKRELEEARLKGEKEHAEVVNSLATIYSTIFRADIITHEYEILNSVPLMGKIAASKGNFDDVKETIIESFIEPEFRQQLREFLDLNTLADRFEKVNTLTMDYKAPTGQWMQARFIAKRRDENGRAVEALYVAHDITNEKNKDLKQQEFLRQALAAAQQANKAKTTFLNNMSHDIRTPMNAIIGFTSLAQTHLDNHTQVEDYLRKISTSSNHLLSLINNILDMSRIESGTVKLDEKAVHIPTLLYDLKAMVQSLVDSKHLNLFINTQDVVHEDVLTDKMRLNQVLLNIVGNAIKFTQPGGDIIIRLVEKPCSLKHYSTYEFSVKDTGIGMSKEFIGHIFDAFSREYSSTVSGIQGTGLGMAITKNIVDMMGGDIRIESEEGKGSLFTVTLNLSIANEPIDNEKIPKLLGARALIVDDDMNTCKSVSKMLCDIQMRPDWTTSAQEAIVQAKDAIDMSDEYKVYIINYQMPDMNGCEIVRRIRKIKSKDTPIIILSSYDLAECEYEARKIGVEAFVSKPIFMSELREVLMHPKMNVKISKEEKNKVYDYSGKSVLLVEDNELNREIATTILEEVGMSVDSVEDGDIAVARINKEPADKYDLILMDVQMPRMDGYTATREIRTLADNQKANIPIVAVTANVFEEDREKAIASGMNGHIIKPISIEEIAKVLDEIFETKKA